MKSNKKKFDRICREIALNNGIPVERVKEEIQTAINRAFENPTEEQKALHQKITRKGKIPNPEEMIDFICRSIK